MSKFPWALFMVAGGLVLVYGVDGWDVAGWILFGVGLFAYTFMLVFMALFAYAMKQTGVFDKKEDGTYTTTFGRKLPK